MKINQLLTTRNCRVLDKRDIKYIVIHYVGAVSTAEANARYFKYSNTRQASCHYFVDDTSIWQSIRQKNEAWHCGGARYNGGGSVYGKCTNYNSIGIEMCCKLKDGKLIVTDKTEKNTIWLVKKLMKKFNIPASRVVRHWDVTGKACPAYWTGTAKRWIDFKAKLEPTSKKTATKLYGYEIGKSYKGIVNLNVRKGPGTTYAIAKVEELPESLAKKCTAKSGKAVIKQGKKITVKEVKKVGDRVWLRVSNDFWLCGKEENLRYIK